MKRYQWTSLNKQQLGRFYEQHMQMELAMRGFQLYPPAVDDHGVDLVTRWQKGDFLELQIKAIRKPSYLFLRKKYFEPGPALFLAVGLHIDDQEPLSLLIPSQVWRQCAEDQLLKDVFCENNYEGLKSEPEYGLRLTPERFEALRNRFSLDVTLANISRPTLMSQPTLDIEFLRTVFSDDFIFSVQPRVHLEQHPNLTREQRDLALEIYASDLYPKEMEKIVELTHSLSDTFGWQGNSEGPLIFVGKILFLLERYDLDAAWLIDVWGPVNRSQSPPY